VAELGGKQIMFRIEKKKKKMHKIHSRNKWKNKCYIVNCQSLKKLPFLKIKQVNNVPKNKSTKVAIYDIGKVLKHFKHMCCSLIWKLFTY